MSELYALVQTRFQNIDPLQFTGILTRTLRWPKVDIQQAGRRSQGILGVRFTREEAEAIQRELAQHHFETAVLPAARLMQLAGQRCVAWLDVRPDGLGVPDDLITDDTTFVPWSSLVVLHAALVAVPQEESAIVEGVDLNRQAPSYEFHRESFGVIQPQLALLGLSAAGQMVHVRLSLAKFFAARMPWLADADGPQEQFRRLLDRLSDSSSQAIQSPSVRELIDRPMYGVGERTPRSRVDRDLQAFQHQMNWLLQLLALRSS